MLPDLKGHIALVTGASRGVGRGLAVGLGEAGATVYITGRSLISSQADVPGTLIETAELVQALGATAIPAACDHTDDAQVQALFKRIASEQGRLDILVNNAWAGYEGFEEEGEFTWLNPFWKQPLRRWDAMFTGGLRTFFTAGRLAAPLMIAQGRGLIANISYWAAQKYMNNIMYGVSKAATDRLSADMAHELRPYGVAAVSLYPGLVRTERVLAAADLFDMSNAESPQFQGRVVAALAADPGLMEKSGLALVTASLALEYGLTDIDGRQPRPLSLQDS